MAHYSNIEDLLADDSFVRWLTGSARTEEQEFWDQWVAEDPAREVMVREAEKLHRSIHYDRFQTPDIPSELSTLEESLSRQETSKTSAYFARKKSKIHYWMRVAAVLLLTVVAGWGIYDGILQRDEEEPHIEWMMSTTEYGEKQVLQLSDGSTIMLNADSRLKYPRRQAGEALQVWLEGEAHFDIEHKTGADRRQFTVHTEDGNIRVLGTQFNVNTRNEQTEVVLEKGRVEIERSDSSQSTPAPHIMKPGELARFGSHQAHIDVEEVNPALYTSWTEDRLLFKGTPLVDIANYIETIYGLEVRVTSPELEGMLVSGAVSNDNLPVLLASLSRLLNVNIDRGEESIVIRDQNGKRRGQ